MFKTLLKKKLTQISKFSIKNCYFVFNSLKKHTLKRKKPSFFVLTKSDTLNVFFLSVPKALRLSVRFIIATPQLNTVVFSTLNL
jgi:hypothetical protein